MLLSAQEGMAPGVTIAEKMVNFEAYGFEGVEFWGSPDLRNRVKEIKDALSTVKLKVSTICAGYPGALLSDRFDERRAAVDGIKERLSLSAELGAVGVIVVPIFGPPRLPDLRPLYPRVYELEKALLIEECRELGRYADDVGAYVLLEPLNRYETHFINRLSQAVEVCKEVNIEHVKIMADFFHMNIEEADIAESLEEAGGYVKHIHLADSNRLLPGYGHIDFKKPFSALRKVGYEGFMALECGIPGPAEIELPKVVKYLKQFIV